MRAPVLQLISARTANGKLSTEPDLKGTNEEAEIDIILNESTSGEMFIKFFNVPLFILFSEVDSSFLKSVRLLIGVRGSLQSMPWRWRDHRMAQATRRR